jgi:acetyl esterase/lipase
VKTASPITYVSNSAPPFLIMRGLADNSVPHGQSVLLYDALAKAGTDVTLGLIDGLPHTFVNRTNLDDLAGPFRMDVREQVRGGNELRREDRAGVFDVRDRSSRSTCGEWAHAQPVQAHDSLLRGTVMRGAKRVSNWVDFGRREA